MNNSSNTHKISSHFCLLLFIIYYYRNTPPVIINIYLAQKYAILYTVQLEFYMLWYYYNKRDIKCKHIFHIKLQLHTVNCRWDPLRNSILTGTDINLKTIWVKNLLIVRKISEHKKGGTMYTAPPNFMRRSGLPTVSIESNLSIDRLKVIRLR